MISRNFWAWSRFTVLWNWLHVIFSLIWRTVWFMHFFPYHVFILTEFWETAKYLISRNFLCCFLNCVKNWCVLFEGKYVHFNSTKKNEFRNRNWKTVQKCHISEILIILCSFRIIKIPKEREKCCNIQIQLRLLMFRITSISFL